MCEIPSIPGEGKKGSLPLDEKRARKAKRRTQTAFHGIAKHKKRHEGNGWASFQMDRMRYDADVKCSDFPSS